MGAVLLGALVVIIACPAWAESPAFPDVPATHPYGAAIADLAGRGIIGGYGNGNFGPSDPVTRQQFAKMIALTGGFSVSENDICPFADVARGDASTFFPDNFIAVCAAHGITAGTSATTFNPAGKMTRYQAVTMVLRAAYDLRPGLLEAPAPPWETTSWGSDPTHGANAIRAEYYGLLDGLDLVALDPYGYMSRGEVAQVLVNLLGKLALRADGATPTEPAALTTDSIRVLSAWSEPQDLTVRAYRIIGGWAAAIVDNDAPAPPEGGPPPMGCISVFRWELSAWTLFEQSSFMGELYLFPTLRWEGVPEDLVRWIELQMGF